MNLQIQKLAQALEEKENVVFSSTDSRILKTLIRYRTLSPLQLYKEVGGNISENLNRLISYDWITKEYDEEYGETFYKPNYEGLRKYDSNLKFLEEPKEKGWLDPYPVDTTYRELTIEVTYVRKITITSFYFVIAKRHGLRNYRELRRYWKALQLGFNSVEELEKYQHELLCYKNVRKFFYKADCLTYSRNLITRHIRTGLSRGFSNYHQYWVHRVLEKGYSSEKEYALEWVNKRGFKTIHEYETANAKKKGFESRHALYKNKLKDKGISYKQYRDELARKKGFENRQAYRKWLIQNGGKSYEKRIFIL